MHSSNSCPSGLLRTTLFIASIFSPSMTTDAPFSIARFMKSSSVASSNSKTGTALLPFNSSPKSFSSKPKRFAPIMNSVHFADCLCGS